MASEEATCPRGCDAGGASCDGAGDTRASGGAGCLEGCAVLPARAIGAATACCSNWSSALPAGGVPGCA
eukprot:6225385-Lingulodinium_polyedra.AAC.1